MSFEWLDFDNPRCTHFFSEGECACAIVNFGMNSALGINYALIATKDISPGLDDPEITVEVLASDISTRETEILRGAAKIIPHIEDSNFNRLCAYSAQLCSFLLNEFAINRFYIYCSDAKAELRMIKGFAANMPRFGFEVAMDSVEFGQAMWIGTRNAT